jgi:hypothetical protein
MVVKRNTFSDTVINQRQGTLKFAGVKGVVVSKIKNRNGFGGHLLDLSVRAKKKSASSIRLSKRN